MGIMENELNEDFETAYPGQSGQDRLSAMKGVWPIFCALGEDYCKWQAMDVDADAALLDLMNGLGIGDGAVENGAVQVGDGQAAAGRGVPPMVAPFQHLDHPAALNVQGFAQGIAAGVDEPQVGGVGGRQPAAGGPPLVFGAVAVNPPGAIQDIDLVASLNGHPDLPVGGGQGQAAGGQAEAAGVAVQDGNGGQRQERDYLAILVSLDDDLDVTILNVRL